MKKLKYWIPAFFWACFIFYMSSRSNVELPHFPFADKIIHLIVYAILGYFTARALSRGHGLERKRTILISLLFSGFYGMTDEFHQSFVPGRAVEFFDLVSDILGGALGGFFYGYLLRHFKRSEREPTDK
ncbi:MAG: VanZ family protein [Deltaproteobacteria bacterium]|nr:VanZ family protein [Deltaproteobacteria bacterium]MBI2341643.1 VanZ family protein [Deltaproteobacteria bacterium]